MTQNRGKQKRAEKHKKKRAQAQQRRRLLPPPERGRAGEGEGEESAYDAGTSPDPTEWLDRDEQERIAIVRDYHAVLPPERRPPNPELHAIMHSIVETQLAGGEPAEARAALDRLRDEGLERHDAIHAIGSVLLRHLTTVMQERRPHDAVGYARDLAALSKASWLASLQMSEHDPRAWTT